MSENNEEVKTGEDTAAEAPKQIAPGSIEVSQEILDQHPHLVEKFGCKVGDVIDERRLDPEWKDENEKAEGDDE